MEEYYRMVVREREKERSNWIAQEHVARLATGGRKKGPASVRPALRMGLAIGIVLVSLAAFALSANMYAGIALLH